MAKQSLTKTATLPAGKLASPSQTVPGKVLSATQNWFKRNKIYFLAFLLPVVLTYIAYALFGIYPFAREGQEQQSVLVLDLNGQYVYYFEALRDAFWGGDSIFYNWSRNLSGGFLGIIGYYLASPFTLIVMLLPEKFMLGSLLIMQLCKLGAAGVTFSCFLQRRRNIKPLNSVLFSTVYAMMAYAVIQMIDPMWLDGVIWLPLIMMGVEYLIEDGRKANYIIALALMFVSHFYIGYMVAIFTALYFVFYLIFGKDRKHMQARDYCMTIVRFGYCTGIALMCSAFMLLSVYSTLQLGKFDFSEPDMTWRVQDGFNLVDLLPQLLPAQYDSVNVQGKPEIYCGLFTVVLLPLFYCNKKIEIRKKIGYSLLLGAMITSIYVVPIDIMWHGGQVPNWLPFRYSFLVSFILVSMAATTFSKLDGIKNLPLGGSLLGILAVLFYINTKGYDQLAKNSIWISAALVCVYIIAIYFMREGLKAGKKWVGLSVCIATIFCISGEAIYNATDSMKDIDKEVAYSSRASYQQFIQTGRAISQELEDYDSSLYRAEKTYFRCINDNNALGLRGISHSSSVMNTKVLNLLSILGYSAQSYSSRYDGNTPIADSLLGIKYVLKKNNDDSSDRMLSTTYTPVQKDGADWTYDYVDQYSTAQTGTVYQNPDALAMGYMVDDDIEILTLGNDNPFNTQNYILSACTGTLANDGPKEYYKKVELDGGEPVVHDVTVSDYNGQVCYTATLDAADPTVDYQITVPDSNPVYFYFKTNNQKKVNLWLGKWSDELQDYGNKDGTSTNYEWFGNYFEGDDYCIKQLGSFEPGTKLCLRMTIANGDAGTNNKYAIVENPLFYSLDVATYEADIQTLQSNQWDITEFSGNKMKGTIQASDGQIMMTSIPNEPGWTVKVDGKKIDYYDKTATDDEGNALAVPEGMYYTSILRAYNTWGSAENGPMDGALLALHLDAGAHTVEMIYRPPHWYLYMLLLVLGIALTVLLYLYDRKHNKAMETERRNRALLAAGLPIPGSLTAKAAKSGTSVREKTAAGSKSVSSSASNSAPSLKAKKQAASRFKIPMLLAGIEAILLVVVGYSAYSAYNAIADGSVEAQTRNTMAGFWIALVVIAVLYQGFMIFIGYRHMQALPKATNETARDSTSELTMLAILQVVLSYCGAYGATVIDEPNTVSISKMLGLAVVIGIAGILSAAAAIWIRMTLCKELDAAEASYQPPKAKEDKSTEKDTDSAESHAKEVAEKQKPKKKPTSDPPDSKQKDDTASASKKEEEENEETDSKED